MKPRLPKKLGYLQLVAIIFFTVSGGPYGIEPLLGFAGRQGAFLLLLITPILWDIPAILTVLELNSMMPVTGGYYQWVKRALGLRFAFYEGWWTWLYTFVDLAIYPVLFVTYASWLFPQIAAYKIPVCFLIIWGAAWLNIRGVLSIGRLSLLLSALVLIPFLLLFGVFLRHPVAVGAAPDALHIPSVGMALYTILWNFIGWDNCTTYAGEVRHPGKTYVAATFTAFALVIGVYSMAIFVASRSGIAPGFLAEHGFPVLGELLGGKWLGYLIAAGGMASTLGLFSAILLSVSRVPEAMAQDRLLPGFLHKHHPRYGTPYISILICAVIVSCLVFFSFGELVLIDVTLYGCGITLEFISLIVLRRTAPGDRRPFRIPLGIPGLVLMILPPLAILAVAMAGSFSGGGALTPILSCVGGVVSAELAWRLVRLIGPSSP